MTEKSTAIRDTSEAHPEIIMTPEGTLIAQVTWKTFTFNEPLPDAFRDWTDPQRVQHLRKHVVGKLKYLVAKAKAKTLQIGAKE